MSDTVDVTVADGIASLSMNRPESLNAFNAELRRELLASVRSAEADSDVRVIILRGEGRAFCAGADLAERHPPGQTAEDRLLHQYKPLLLALTEASKPVIGVVQGAAAGIGCALAMSCDLVIMGESGYYLQAFSAVGLVPDGGLSWHLPRQLGSKLAFELMVTGEKLLAQRCLQLGLVNHVVADESLDAEAQSYAAKLSDRAPLTLRYTKEAIRRSVSLSLSDAISMEAGLQRVTSASLDHAEGKAAFLEKRRPKWRGK